ncbi:unnamed protein product [Somion occarium]|uniref:26S proteasome regulatory subunit RPN1 n=1 Tax=Somion occarium TaxID=3059160 RepID=A0ABP1DMQ1_9APHY
MAQPTPFALTVPSEDPKKRAKKTEEEGKEKLKDDTKEGEDLSDEDLQLKNELEMLLERLKEPNTELYRPALETLRTLIRTSTSSMTSVPKPLKFLHPHYPELQSLHEKWPPSEDKSLFADILSVLAMTYSDTQPRGTLRYRLLSDSLRPAGSPISEPGSWGHEYVRHLAAELGEEYNARELGEEEENKPVINGIDGKPGVIGTDDQLRVLAMECATFLLQHNAEPDAVDLLEELEIVDRITELLDENTYSRVCQYMVACVNLLPPPDDAAFLRTAHRIYVQHKKFPEALSLSIRIGDPQLIRDDFHAPANPLMKRQLAFYLARAQIPKEWLELDEEEELPEDLLDCLSNTRLSQHFKDFGKELSVLEPKSLEDVYKSHLENTRTTATVDSARANLAGTFVNAFVNAGFGSHREDLLQLLLPHVADDAVSMEVASLSALALGFVFVGSGNGEIVSTILQTLMEREDSQLGEKWARYMALGLALVNLGLQDGSDATIATLQAIEHPISKQAEVLVDMCSFAGTGNVLKVQAFLHHCDEHIVKDKEEKKEEKKEENEKKEGEKEGESEEGKKEEKPKDDTFQAFAVLGIALVAMGEDVGAEMSMRMFNHLMHYGEPIIRKAVPLALGLVSASNPQLPILDTLSKYSHDNDLQVALNAIFAMGLVGAGTNNARLAQMLRQLAGYYYKEPDCLFVVRIAQGLVNMGKGTISINPFFMDRQIMSRTAVAGLLATLIAFIDAKSFVLDKYHWFLYFLVTAMYPRFLITLDEKLESFPVTVRVGQAVDVVGQAGKPRTISGFQTHSTPVRLGTTERAELATEEYIPFAHVLEGLVILQKNPGYEKEDKMEV